MYYQHKANEKVLKQNNFVGNNSMHNRSQKSINTITTTYDRCTSKSPDYTKSKQNLQQQHHGDSNKKPNALRQSKDSTGTPNKDNSLIKMGSNENYLAKEKISKLKSLTPRDSSMNLRLISPNLMTNPNDDSLARDKSKSKLATITTTAATSAIAAGLFQMTFIESEETPIHKNKHNELNKSKGESNNTSTNTSTVSTITSATTYQQKQMQYISRISYLEKENNCLKTLINDKDAKIKILLKKNKDDKLKIEQMGNEIENFKELSLYAKSTNEISISELSEVKKVEKQNKSIDIQSPNEHDHQDNQKCNRCAIYLAYCEKLTKNLAEIEESSRFLMSNCSSLKEQLEESKKSEEAYMKIYADLENRYRDLGRDLVCSKQKCDELQAELITMRSMMSNTLSKQQQQQQNQQQRQHQRQQSLSTLPDTSSNSLFNEPKSPSRRKNNNTKSPDLERNSIQTLGNNNYIPSSLKAIMYAQQFIESQKVLC